MRRGWLIGSLIVLWLAVLSAQAPPRDAQRELATSVADGFTVAAVGDCIITGLSPGAIMVLPYTWPDIQPPSQPIPPP